MMKIFAHFSFLLISILMLSPSYGQVKAKSKAGASRGTAFKPEALSAKALLEDLLARRYSQELSTKIEKSYFSMGANLDLVEVPPAKDKVAPGESEPISDLMLGTIDPEDLIKKYAGNEEKQAVQGFLKNFKITAVQMSVGLKDSVSDETKAEVEKWLTERIQSEFGTTGKGMVSKITVPVDQVEDATGFMKKLEKFQSLAGQAVMALAIILGILFWKLLSSSKSLNVDMKGETTNQNQGAQGGAGAVAADKVRIQEEEERTRLNRSLSAEIEKTSKELNDLVPRLSGQLESIIRTWCQTGELGKVRLACFAEAVGREIGKLPIPVDALADVTKIFGKMTDLGLKEKSEHLQKAYWDLLTALNLGAESLAQPFGYLGGLNIGMINQILLDQNPKSKALVSLFMPSDLRGKFVQGLSFEEKKQLLQSASELSEVGSAELKSLDGSIMSKLKPAGSSGDVVPLDLTLQKVVSSLTASEEVVLLSDIVGPAMRAFKASYPSLAFLAEWPDAELTILLSRAMPDEVVVLSRLRPDFQSRLLSLAPPMTAEMATDELSRPDQMNSKDKDHWIDSFAKRLKNVVELKEVNLEEIFKESTAESDSNGAQIKAA